MDVFFILCANYLIILPVIILGAYFWKQPKSHWKDLAIFAVSSAILAYIIAIIASHIYFDPRPFVVGNFTPLIPHAPDNGFPSDHVLLASAIASIGYVWNKRLGITLWILATIIGYARIYTGVHHLTDIVGSIIISIIATYIVLSFQRKIKMKKSNKK